MGSLVIAAEKNIAYGQTDRQTDRRMDGQVDRTKTYMPPACWAEA